MLVHMFAISRGKVNFRDCISFYTYTKKPMLVLMCIIYTCAYTDFRFTEELFATLIAFIFIFNAFKNLASIGTHNKFAPTSLAVVGCQCSPNDSLSNEQDDFNWNNLTKDDCIKLNGTMV